MFSIKQLVNKITDKSGGGGGREGAGESTASFVESDDHHSAEGFLCPPCMRAFPSAESLEDHYKKHHMTEASGSSSEIDSDVQVLQEEILDLQTKLAEERSASEELKNEVIKIQAEFNLKDQFENDSLRSQEKQFEDAKTIMTSEITTLKQQLIEQTKENSIERQEKEALKLTIQSLTIENEKMKNFLIQESKLESAEKLREELTNVKEGICQLSVEKQQIDKLNLKISELVEDINLKESKISQFDKVLEQINSSNEQKVQILNKENEDLCHHISDITKNLEKSQAEKENLIGKHDVDISNVENMRLALGRENSELKEEVARIRAELNELYGKIDTGEGAKAALDGLQKENEIVMQNLDSSQNQNRELNKNIHNLKIEVEKSNSACKKMLEAHAAEVEQLNEKILLYKEQLQGKEVDIKKFVKKNEEHVKTIHIKDGEIKAAKGEIEKMSINCAEAKEAHNEQIKKMRSEFEVCEKSLKNNYLRINQEHEGFKTSMESSIAEKERRILESSELLTTSKNIIKALEEKLARIESNYLEEKRLLNSKIQDLEKNLQVKEDALNKYKIKISELEELEMNSQSKMKSLNDELMNQRELFNKKEQDVETLEKTMEENNFKLQESQSKFYTLEAELEEEKKAKSLLLERCLSGESEGERLEGTIKDLRRKLEDAQAGLREIGREYQNLQMETAKLQGRKWVDDSDVTNCPICSKDFNLRNRKHHCRQCGDVVCHNCSSHIAKLPCSKNPVRICDPCFQELNR